MGISFEIENKLEVHVDYACSVFLTDKDPYGQEIMIVISKERFQKIVNYFQNVIYEIEESERLNNA
jgi:hypothetical protein